MRVAALATGLLLGACGGQPQPAPSAAATPGAKAAPAALPAAQPAPQRQIGTVSALTASTSALNAEVSDFQVERTDTGTRVLLAADTLFAFDKASLTPAAESNLQRAADLIREGGAGTVTITGYTDSKGEDAYNLDLSRRRAQAVANWLEARSGLSSGFTVRGLGEAAPVAANARPDGSDAPDGRARNRRVTIDIPR